MALPAILIPIGVAVAGFGAKKAYDGYQDKSKADEILEKAEKNYQEAKEEFDSSEKHVSEKLEQLGKLQLQIGQEFKEFRTLADDFLGKLNNSSDGKDLQIHIPQHKLNEIKQLEISTTTFLAQVAGGGVAGAAAAYATYGGVMALAAASTGTSISALSGVAAYNATMAAIGGGSLAAGGMGMAGGTAILGGLVAAPVVAALGWAYASHAEKALEHARETKKEVREAVEKIGAALEQFRKIRKYVGTTYDVTDNIHGIFMKYFGKLKEVHKLLDSSVLDKSQKDALLSSMEDRVMLDIENGYKVAAVLTDIITTPLFKVKKDEEGKVLLGEDNAMEFEEDLHGNKIINAEEIELSWQTAHADMKKLSANYK